MLLYGVDVDYDGRGHTEALRAQSSVGAALLYGVDPPLRKASIFKVRRRKTARQVVDGLLATTVGVERAGE